MRIMMPITLKIFLPAILGVACTVGLLRDLALRGLDRDRTEFGLETAKTVGEALRDEVETLVKFRLQELERLAQDLRKGSESRLFARASSDFRGDVLAVTFFHPTGKENYSIRFATNWDLLTRKSLPQNSVFLLNQASPLDVRRIARERNTTVLNRSFANGDTAVPVLTYVLFGRHLDGHPQGTLFVVDVVADELLTKLRRSETVETFLVDGKGQLIAHSDPSTLLQFKSKEFPAFPVASLASDWMQGANFGYSVNEKEWLNAITPTGLPGVFLCSRVEKRNFTKVLLGLQEQFWYGAGLIVGVLALICALISRGLTRNARNTAATLGYLSQGDFDRIPRLHSRDEFLYVRDAFKVFGPRLRTKLREEFERGQKDTLLATVQTFRASMGNPVPGSFDSWEIVTHRPQGIVTSQDFWDFHQQGNRRQVIVGRASTEGISGVQFALMCRTTMDNLRRLSSKFSTQRAPSFAELLELLNASLHAAYKGRVCLIGTAFEIDIDSGSFNWINMGGPSPWRWLPESKKPLAFDDKSLAAQNPSLGLQPVAGYRAINGIFAPGERVLVHTSFPVAKGAIDDPNRKALQRIAVMEGRKALADLKSAVLAPSNPSLFRDSLCLLGLRRPGGENLETVTPPAAAKKAA